MNIAGSDFRQIAMFIASALACLLILLAWRRRAASGSRQFILLMLAVAVYAFFAGFEISAATIPLKISWSQLSYLGVVNLAPCWFWFALAYSHPENRIPRSVIVLLWIVPLITLGLAFTNEWHHLIWTTFTYTSQEPGSLLIYGHGTGFWIHTIYAYLLMLAGTYLLIRSVWHAPQLFQWQVVMIIIASLIPWTGNILVIFNLTPWRGLDLSPIAFLLTGYLLVASIYRFHTFDLVPVARGIAFNSIGAGVLVLDNRNRLVDINPVAKQWTNLGDEAIGRSLFEALSSNEMARRYEHTPEAQAVIEIGKGEKRRIVNLTISPIRDGRGALQGRVVLLHDTSTEHSLRKAEHRHARQMELLNSITLVALGYPELPNMYQILADRLGELFEADGAYLTLWDEEEQRAIPTAAHGEMRESYQEIIVHPGEKTMTESALLAGQVLVVEDTFNTPYMSRRVAALFPTRSGLALPLIANGKKLGAAIISFLQTHDFTPQEIALAEQAAGQIALAIDKSWMVDEERRRNAQLTALQSVSRAVAASLDVGQIFETVVNVLSDTFKYPYVSIYLLYGDMLKLGAQKGYPLKMICREIPVGRGVMGRTIRSRETQFVRDVTTDPDFICASYEVGSEICVPLLKDRTALGTLNVESPSHRPLTEKDVQLLTSFADQVTVAVENARLYELEQRRRQEVAAIAEVGRDISASLRLDIVLERIAMYARNLLRAETSAVYIYDPTQSILIANSAIGPDADEIKRDPVRIGEGILGNIFLQKTGEIVNETSGDPRAITIQGTEDVVDEHLIGAPILSRDQLTGLIAVWRIGTGEEFESTDLDFLNDLALQAAIAIENARLYAKAQHTAILDELTGAYNRRGLFEIGKQEFDRSVRFKRSLVALFLDIDHFKKFNDTFSYAVGDLVLRMFTDCLRSNLREFDLIGRYGGEEFVVLLPEAEIEAAREVAERIRKSVAALKVQTDRGETGITVSIGVCARTLQMPGLEALIDQAGQITHLAKHDGRNRVVVGQ